ncbi:chemotaxis protein CheB [Mycobacterium yunnanensis]|uniref:protein-glutamate methylesterase n=1 Tax=Mycobacterium yunnanensis TaxID=368477 RepID=A0A9X2YZQ2_9MYCO|nr:chemotaxis protein CheB [Mycobacterium yunnanensis]MCV7421278.1 chemotaxis protein CheB [Mycobacterium yunnanensis]
MEEEIGTNVNAPRGVIAIGASAGGVEALKQLVGGLPAGLPHAVLVALHMSSATPSVLAQILDRHGPLPVSQGVDGELLRAGHVYVATPDRHLLVRRRRIVVSRGPTEDGHRPAINALLRSAAVDFGSRAIGVLLSGVLDDGVLGLTAIRARGGVTVVQAPDDALFPDMPRNAIAAQIVDHQVAAAAAGQLFASLADRPGQEGETVFDPMMEAENDIAMGPRFSDVFDAETLGPPSGFTCPDCNGSLVSVGSTNYRCRVGHAWTPEALLRARDRETENALWVALRSLEEKAKLSRKHESIVSPGALQRRYAEIAEEAEHAVAVLRSRLSELLDDDGDAPDASIA